MMTQVMVYLAAMIIIVPLSKWLGLGTVLGYLIAGALLGPQSLGWIAGSQADASHLSEFGVIMMLLMIGLELNPKVLWKMRGPILGLGGAQVVVTTVVFAALAYGVGQAWQSALAIGMILAGSSTAIVLQTLKEKGFSKSQAGENAFAILLFQDMAVILMLASLPLLASSLHEGSAGALPTEGARPAWQQALIVLSAIAGLIAAGRFLVKPIFRMIARLQLREILTAAALLLVVGTTALMQMVGLSPALGAFLAGVVLADSEFRHQIEADLEPFKALLLGLFFISIGAGINLHLPLAKPLEIAGIVLCLLFFKGTLIFGLGRLFRMPVSHALLLGASLAQGGEFAFVLLGLSQQGGLLQVEIAQLVTTGVAISMAFAPLFITAAIRWGMPMLTPPKADPEFNVADDQDSGALVIGIGRFGQVIVRLLRANGFSTTVLDYDAEQVSVMERFGMRSYFGDGSRLELLRAAGIEHMKILVIAIDDRETALRIVEMVRREFPRVEIFARAFDRPHAYKLLNAGVSQTVIETGGSAIDLGEEILRSLGYTAWRAHRQSRIFRRQSKRSLVELAPLSVNTERSLFIREVRQRSDMLEALLRSESGKTNDDDRAWDSAPLES